MPISAPIGRECIPRTVKPNSLGHFVRRLGFNCAIPLSGARSTSVRRKEMRFLERKTEIHAIERVGCVATAPDGKIRTMATCNYVLLSASSVAGGRETQWRQHKGKERCAHFSGILSLLKDFESAFWGCWGNLPTDAARGAPKTRARALRARVRMPTALVVVCACLSRVVPAAATPRSCSLWATPAGP